MKNKISTIFGCGPVHEETPCFSFYAKYNAQHLKHTHRFPWCDYTLRFNVRLNSLNVMVSMFRNWKFSWKLSRLVARTTSSACIRCQVIGCLLDCSNCSYNFKVPKPRSIDLWIQKCSFLLKFLFVLYLDQFLFSMNGKL